MAAAVSAEPYDRFERAVIFVVALVFCDDDKMALMPNDSGAGDVTWTGWDVIAGADDEFVMRDASVILGSEVSVLSYSSVMYFSFASRVMCV